MSLNDALAQHVKTTTGDERYVRALQKYNLGNAEGCEMFWGYMALNESDISSCDPALYKLLMDHQEELRGKQKSSDTIRRDVKGLDFNNADDYQRLQGIVNMYGSSACPEADAVLDALINNGVKAAKELQKQL
jgi:hypothetical protein